MADVWFAPTLQYLPVRLLIRQDEDTYVDLMIDRLPQQEAGAERRPQAPRPEIEEARAVVGRGLAAARIADDALRGLHQGPQLIGRTGALHLDGQRLGHRADQVGEQPHGLGARGLEIARRQRRRSRRAAGGGAARRRGGAAALVGRCAARPA